MNQEINTRIRIIVHRLWWLAKIGARTGMINEGTIVIGGRGAMKTYHTRIFLAMKKLEMELYQIRATAFLPIPKFPPGGHPHEGGLAMIGEGDREMIMLPAGEKVFGPSMLTPALQVMKNMKLALDARESFSRRWSDYNTMDNFKKSLMPVIEPPLYLTYIIDKDGVAHKVPHPIAVDILPQTDEQFLKNQVSVSFGYDMKALADIYGVPSELIEGPEPPVQRTQTNIDLHQLPTYQGIECHLCKRTYPTTVLNIEAVIHHHAKAYTCVNTKDCRRARRKTKH